MLNQHQSRILKKRDVDKSYRKLMERLLQHGYFPAIATHDEMMINHAKEFAHEHSIPKNFFEFQMLYGVRQDLQRQLVKEGYDVRVYVPYGTEWYPYLSRRIGERPANLGFIASSIASEAFQNLTNYNKLV